MKTIDKGTLTRTILLVLALANQLLTASGHSVIPIDDATVTNIISNWFHRSNCTRFMVEE